jgi:uncharacterized membrane protein YtjA (UPF0391 family)
MLRQPLAAASSALPHERHCFCYSTAGTRSALAVEEKMLYYALIFLIVALIAGALGVSGVAAVASQIAWVLFVIAIILFIVHFITGRRTRVP